MQSCSHKKRSAAEKNGNIAPLRHEATRGTLRGVLIMKITFA